MLPFILAHIAFAIIPGKILREYKNKEEIVLFLNKLDSSKTLIPFKYNYLKYCDPKEGEEESENIGQELSGDYLKESKYDIKMNVSILCTVLCVKELKDSHKERFRWMIENQYQASWVLDSLPAAEIRVGESRTKMKKFYKDGFPIGIQNGHEFYVFNHHNIEIEYYQSNDYFYVVGFSVEALNMKSEWIKNIRCDKNIYYYSELPAENKDSSDGYKKELFEELSNITKITYSYSVTFKKVATKWANRWGNYITPSESDSTHYYNLVNSTLIVFLLTGMVATILRRSALRDVSVYNESDELEIETGWKKVRSDVFRPPMFFGLFSILIGTGTQIILSCWLILIFAVFNFFSPKFQGALLSAGILFYALMGIFAGYVSSRLYKMFGGISWQKNAIGTAILMPGVCMSTFLIINFFLTLEESSGAVSFESFLYLLEVWLLFSSGFVYMGAFAGTSQNPLQNSSSVSGIPKPVENVSGLNRVRLIGLLAGVLPFASIIIEINFIMPSLWHPEKFYNFFGFMFICSIILIITSAEAAILVVYLLLCREDYRWWWLSVFVPGSSGIYLFLFSVYYCFYVLELSFFTSFVTYFGYMFLICLGFMIVTGTIGFYGSYLFVNVIYSMIEQDYLG